MTPPTAEAVADLRHCIAIASREQPDWREVWEAALRALSAVPDDGLGSSLRDTHRVPDGWVLVPKEPTEAMLRGACDKHTPGEPMSEDRREECPRFGTRRRIWDRMIEASSDAPAEEARTENSVGIGAADGPKAVPTGDAEGAVVGLETGDLWWNPEDPENGFNSMEDAFGDATQWDYEGPVKLDRASLLPSVWALKVDLDTTGDGEADDYEIRLFATEAEAEAYKADCEAPTTPAGSE